MDSLIDFIHLHKPRLLFKNKKNEKKELLVDRETRTGEHRDSNLRAITDPPIQDLRLNHSATGPIQKLRCQKSYFKLS